MVGGGLRKENGLPAISSTNIFAALESRRRKSSKKRLENSSCKGAEAKKDNGNKVEQVEQPAQFWAPSLISVTSWADVEDDDDYYATTAPPPLPSEKLAEILEAHTNALSHGEESEVDEDAEDDIEDGVEDDADVEANDTVSLERISQIPTAPSTPVVREPERQLSKRELKKKELAELDAVLAELGLVKQPEDGNDTSPIEEKKLDASNHESCESELKRGTDTVLTETKNSKRRKAKKEKSFKDVKDGEGLTFAEVEAEAKWEDRGAQSGEVVSVPADPKEVLKKLASLKKKKSLKDNDVAAKAAAAEASARAAKLAAAKKKEKNHYNQQPVR